MADRGPFKTPLLRVSRPVSACSKCRSAKIKCDGKLPACSACERNGRRAECSSANDQFAKGKERSYVASLESRKEKLEKRLAQLKGRSRSIDLLGSQIVGPSSLLSVPLSTTGLKVERREAVVVDDLVSDFGFLSLNATSRDFHGFTKDMSFARLVLSASSLDRMPRIYDSGLAPRHAIIPLVDHYLDNIYVLYPFFSEIKLFASLDVLYQEDGRNADAIDHWHVRMVLAIALASRSRRRDDEDYREAISHAAAAFNRAETVIQPGSLVGIQAILLLVLYSIFDPYHFSSWYLIGVASRVMVDLGLHQDSADPSLMKDSQVQMRHRIYHSVYTLDRMISMTHLKAFSFTDDSTNVASSFTDDSNNVAFRWDPRPYSVTWNGLHEQHQLFLRQLHPAMQILQLRQMQSSVYQLNFQTRNRSDHDTWPSVVNFLEKTQLWAEKIPNVIQRPMKQLLRSEVMYGCIIALSPPGFTHINAYGTALLFTYTVEYASIMSTVDGDLKHFAFCTFNDILRASHVADRFLSVIAENSWSTLLHEGMPKSCSMSLHSGFVTPPSLPPWSVIDVLDKAVMCLKMLERTLDNLGQRFDKPGPLKEYKIKSKGVRFMLDSRREQWSRTDRQHTT